MMLPIKNYLRLDPHLASAGQPTEQQLAWMTERGTNIVINLGLSEAGYALPDEGNLVRQLGMTYIHIPVPWDSPSTEDLVTFMDAMDVHHDKKVFVHCAANMRASVFIALYRILRLNWDPPLALEWVYQVWDPNPTWRSFIQEQMPPG